MMKNVWRARYVFDFGIFISKKNMTESKRKKKHFRFRGFSCCCQLLHIISTQAKSLTPGFSQGQDNSAAAWLLGMFKNRQDPIQESQTADGWDYLIDISMKYIWISELGHNLTAVIEMVMYDPDCKSRYFVTFSLQHLFS